MSTLLTLPYKIARLPWSLVDQRVSSRLPEASPSRVLLGKVIGSSDRLAGSLLGDPDLAGRGSERLERSQQVEASVSLPQQAADARREARQTAEVGREEAERRRAASGKSPRSEG
jgi:hypothetical protein